jgi:hypothetical protein
MPCNSDYLEPSNREREHQRAAKLLAYIHERMAIDCPAWITKEAANHYANDERLIPLLCTTMTNMGDVMRDNFTYKSARLPMARDLADWWETHQAADKARVEREQKLEAQATLRSQALAKLTPAERRALGLF